MKKILIVTNVITLTVLILILCCGRSWRIIRKQICREVIQSTTPKPECTNCYPGTCNDPFTGVDVRLAKSLVKNYGNTFGACTEYPDSRAAWFSLNAIKRFIYEIEKKVCDSCNNQLELGVRVYYGAYPATSEWTTMGDALQGVDPASNEMHTVLMVPTYYDGTKDVDFDPAFVKNGCVPQSFCDVFDTKYNTAVTMTALVPMSMQNHGTMTPPGTPGAFMLKVANDETCDESNGSGGE